MNVSLSADTQWDISYLLSTGLYSGIREVIDVALRLAIEAGRGEPLSAPGNDSPTLSQPGNASPAPSPDALQLRTLWDERDSWIVALPPTSSALLRALCRASGTHDSGVELEAALSHLCEVRKPEHFKAALQAGIDEADTGHLIEVTESWRRELRQSVRDKHRERERNTKAGQAWVIPHQL